MKKPVTRFEVIDETGRVYAINPCEVELSYQDEGSTLKVFIKRTHAQWAYGSGPRSLAGNEDL